jgi:hypothetical protein
LGYGEKGKLVYRSFFKVGDLVYERHHPDWMGVVVTEFQRDDEQFLVVEWLMNNNNVTNGNREVLHARYVRLIPKDEGGFDD